MNGFIQVHRKMLENPTVFKDADHVAVWMYLLLNARAFPKEVTFHGDVITLQPGQQTTGRKKIAEFLHISESKVQRILKRFEDEHQIEQRTDRQCRLITILSWDKYQIVEQRNEQRANNERTTTEQQLNTKRESNTGNNDLSVSIKKPHGEFGRVLLTDREYKKLQKDFPEDYQDAIRIVDEYLAQHGKSYKSCAAAIRRWAIGAARKEKLERGGNDAGRSDHKRSRMAGTVGRNDGAAQNFADCDIPMAQDFFGS